MILTVVVGLTILLLGVTFAVIQRSRRYARYQAKLDAAFDRAQEVRMQRPPGLYGERAWSTATSRPRGNQITMLNF